MRSIILSIFFLTAITLILFSCQNAEQVKQDIYHANGRDLYVKYCQNCHGTNGEGLNALAPPLTDTTFLKENRQKIACFIKYGLNDTITVNHQKYEDKMPDFPTLADIDIAQIIVYITNSYGNQQGMYTTDQIAADLKNCN